MAETAKPREVFLVAQLNGKPIGCGALRQYDLDHAELKRMFVAADHRRLGVARSIIDELEGYAREFGYKSILLETGILQPEAQSLYEKCGYERIPSFGPYSNNPTSVCFRKQLPFKNETMTPDHYRIKTDDLTGPEIADLLSEHLRCMFELSPPESVHALDLEKLRKPEITFWSVWQGKELAGCGALKELDSAHGEVKSMRTAKNHLNRGVATIVLNQIISEAKRRGYSRLSLETGASASFKPAHGLYTKFGFQNCAPFGEYVPDSNSLFMTLAL